MEWRDRITCICVYLLDEDGIVKADTSVVADAPDSGSRLVGELEII